MSIKATTFYRATCDLCDADDWDGDDDWDDTFYAKSPDHARSHALDESGWAEGVGDLIYCNPCSNEKCCRDCRRPFTSDRRRCVKDGRACTSCHVACDCKGES